MNKATIALAVFLVSATAFAGNFEERVRSASALFETEDGEAYDKSLIPHIQAAIKKCAPASSTSREDTGKFVLVYDVSSTGKTSDPVVSPETKVSLCFSREFFSQTLPVPPGSMLTNGIAPVVVEVFVVP